MSWVGPSHLLAIYKDWPHNKEGPRGVCSQEMGGRFGVEAHVGRGFLKGGEWGRPAPT